MLRLFPPSAKTPWLLDFLVERAGFHCCVVTSTKCHTAPELRRPLWLALLGEHSRVPLGGIFRSGILLLRRNHSQRVTLLLPLICLSRQTLSYLDSRAFEGVIWHSKLFVSTIIDFWRRKVCWSPCTAHKPRCDSKTVETATSTKRNIVVKLKQHSIF